MATPEVTKGNTYDMTKLSKSITVSSGDVLNFPYTGDKISFNFPAGTYKLECWGAQGGNGYYSSSSTTRNTSFGGYSTGILTVDQKTNIYVYVGGAGTKYSTNASGGFNGGGACYSSNSRYMNSGGGASDIRIGQDSLYARVIVAGGGGGCYETGIPNDYSSSGGGTIGIQGTNNTATSTAGDRYGGGGSQTSGGAARTTTSWDSSYINTHLTGSFGKGGGSNGISMQYINGGGGGWYGGGAGGPDGGAGGGSSYVYTSSTASNYPSGCLLNSSYYLTDAQTVAGNTSFSSPTGSSETGHSGNGYIRITVVSGGGRIKNGSSSSTTVKTFTAKYTGAVQQVTLKSGQYKLECWGAQGGTNGSYIGGYGGYSVGTLTVTEKTQLYLYAGGAGSSSGTAAGFNGGGAGVSSGRGGGGGSDIRIGTDSLYARVIVAGGGGGAGVTSASANPAGCGGGLYGGDGYYNNTTGSYTTGSNRCGGSASQTAGGITWSNGTQASFGQGGNASGYSCGGGGGGWYGGGGAYDNDSDSDGRWGGGGSGYVYTSSTASNYPSGCLLNSSYYLTDASTTAGSTSAPSPDDGTQKFNAGDGCVKITAITGGIVTGGAEYELVETLDYSYTGTVQQVTLPKGKYKLECWGASGQYTISSPFSDSNAAYYAGAYASGTLVSDKETTLYLCVGETAYGKNTAQKGMFNGGGAKYGSSDDNGMGGGATHISLLPHTVSQDSYYRWVASSDGLNSRILVAGGGGNGRSTDSTMYAGYAPSYTISQSGYSGGMTSSPSQSSGQVGGFGYGGTVTSTGDTASSGGGGWYGGGSPGDSYGGGGSSFAWCSQYAGYVPSTWKLDSSTYLTDINLICAKDSMPSYSTSGATMTGNQKADGHIRITVYKKVSAAEFQIKVNNAICTSSAAYIKVNGEWKEIADRYVKVNGNWVS